VGGWVYIPSEQTDIDNKYCQFCEESA